MTATSDLVTALRRAAEAEKRADAAEARADAANEELIDARAKLSKLLDLNRAWGKGEPTENVMDNVRNVLYGLTLVNEPTWAYNRTEHES